MSDFSNDLPTLEEIENAKKQQQPQFININAVDEYEGANVEKQKQPQFININAIDDYDGDAAPLMEHNQKGETLQETVERVDTHMPGTIQEKNISTPGTDGDAPIPVEYTKPIEKEYEKPATDGDDAAPMMERTTSGETVEQETDSETVQEKKYNTFELKNEINAGRYDAVGMGDIEGKRKKYMSEDGERVDKHSSSMHTLISTIEMVEEELNNKINTTDPDEGLRFVYLNFKRISDFADSYLYKHKRTWTKEGQARKKMVQMIMESSTKEWELLTSKKVKEAAEAYAAAGNTNATYKDALLAASADKIGEIRPAQIAETKKQEEEQDLPTLEDLEAAKELTAQTIPENIEKYENEKKESEQTKENTDTKETTENTETKETTENTETKETTENTETKETTETKESTESEETTETKEAGETVAEQKQQQKEEEQDIPDKEEFDRLQKEVQEKREKEELENMETPGYGHIETFDGKIYHDADKMPENLETPSYFIQKSIEEDEIMVSELAKKVSERRKEAGREYNLRLYDGQFHPETGYEQWYIDDCVLSHRVGVLKQKRKFLEAAKELEAKGKGKAAMEVFAHNYNSIDGFVNAMRESDPLDPRHMALKKEFKDSKLNSMTVNHSERVDYDIFYYNKDRSEKGVSGLDSYYHSYNSRLTRGFGDGYLLDIKDKENFERVFDKDTYKEELADDQKVKDFDKKYYDYSAKEYFTLFKAMKEITQKCERARLIKEKCGIDGARELSKNKLASSVLAHYMGIEGLIEKTTLSDIQLGDKHEIRITTEASTQSSVEEEIKKVDNLGAQFRYSTTGLKDAMSLKVFSLITGNVSHTEYKFNNPLRGDFVKKEDGSLEMTNIKSYNNEYSFGNLKIETEAEIERELPAIDEELANTILGMKSGFLDYFLKETLDKASIEACKARLLVVKNVIKKWQKSDSSRIISSPEGWEQVREDFEEGKISSDVLDNRLRKGRPTGHGKMYGDDFKNNR